MDNKLTNRQQEILTFINSFIHRHGHPPTLKEIKEYFGFASDNSVRTHIKLIQKKGFINRVQNKARGLLPVETIKILNINSKSIPLIGQIAAGKPILALENLGNYISVDRELFKDENIFALRTRGDSMVGAGIHDGDIVIVHPQETAENSEIVVALIGDEATLKFYHKDGNTIILKAANPAYQDIVLNLSQASEIRVVGKVIGLIRKL